MKVINKTKFVTDDLRSMARACVYFWNAEERVQSVTFKPARRRTTITTGLCWTRSGDIEINLPNDADSRVRCVASTLEHEVDHARGLDHYDMTPDVEREMPWLLGLVLRHQNREPNPDGLKLADAQRRYALAVASKRKAETNLKRAWSTESRLRGRVNYYQKKMEGK